MKQRLSLVMVVVLLLSGTYLAVVAAAQNEIPVATILTPANGTQVVQGSEVLIQVMAVDREDITHVILSEEGVGEIETHYLRRDALHPVYPMLFSWQATTPGEHTLSVVVYRGGVESFPAQVTLTVVESSSEVENPPALPDVMEPLPDDLTTSCYAIIRIPEAVAYSAPGSGEQVDRLLLGEVVRPIAQQQNFAWLQVVNHVGKQEWIESRDVLRLGNCQTIGWGEGVVSVSSSDQLLCYAGISSGDTPVRTDPNDSASILYTLPQGSRWQITQQQGDWLQLNVDGAAVWIPANAVTVGGNCSALNLTIEARPPVPPNQSPSLQPIPNQVVAVGQNVTIAVPATDPDGDPLTVMAQSGSDAVALVAPDGQGNLVITGVGVGQVNVQVSVVDASGGQASTIFTVQVSSPSTDSGVNQPPAIEFIADQTLVQGQTILVPVTATDPEGFNVFLSEVSSSADTIASVGTDNNRNLVIIGVSPGQAVLSVTVSDGSGAQTAISFTVNVLAPTAEPPNQPPVVQPIEDVQMNVGGSSDVFITATDPEGFNIFIDAINSSAQTIATAELVGDKRVRVTGMSPGVATITILVSDGNGGQASTSFRARVSPVATSVPNQPPVVQPILDQVVGVGQSVTVFVSAVDPEGFNVFFESVTSSADTIATAAPDGQGNILVTGVSAGQTTVTVVADDGNGGQTTTDFMVTVNATEAGAVGTQPPQVAPIPPQQVRLNEFLPLTLQARDPDGGNITLSATSSAETIAAVQINDTGVMIFGAGVGQAVITVLAVDEQGQSSAIVFVVTVVGEVGLDLQQLSSLPVWTPDLVSNLAAIHAATTGQNDSLLVLGDGLPAELWSDGGLGTLDLSQQPSLQATHQLYSARPQAITSIALIDLLNPDRRSEECQDYETPLACGIGLYQPTVALLLVGRSDALAGTSPEDFQTVLVTVVDQLTAQGVIPVLVTLPGDARVDLFNQAIAQVAAQKRLPLWNLWASVPAQNVQNDLSLTQPPTVAGDVLSLEAVSQYGASQRNFELLQLLTELRQNVPIN